jgi:hypothetical protein
MDLEDTGWESVDWIVDVDWFRGFGTLTAPMHQGRKQRALCAPPLVSPSSPEALYVK